MKSLADIVNSRDAYSSSSTTIAVGTKERVKVASIAILGSTLGKQKASEFADDAAKLVTDERFLNELERKIGMPKRNETEDEFVARAKRSMFQMLQKKLG